MGALAPPSGSVSASGSIDIRVTWIGQGTAPSEVWLLINSSAQWSGDTGACDDGLDDKPISLTSGQISKGTHVRHLTYSGQPVITTVPLSANAYTSTLYKGYTISLGLSAAITTKDVGIGCDWDMTYHKEGEETRVSNDVIDIENVFGDTVAQYWYFFDDLGFLHDGWDSVSTFRRHLYGTWAPGNSPYNQWVASPEHWEDTFFSEITDVTPTQWIFTEDEVLAAGRTGIPIEKVVNLTVTDDDGQGDSRSAKYTMRIHAPAENPVVVVSDPLLTDNYVDSPSVTIEHGQREVTDSYVFSATLTVTASLSLESSFTIKLFENKVNVALSGSASISWQRSRTVTWTPPAEEGMQTTWWFRRRAYYRNVDASWDEYGVHGFVDHASRRGTTFRAPDAVTAAANDYDDHEMSLTVPIGS